MVLKKFAQLLSVLSVASVSKNNDYHKNEIIDQRVSHQPYHESPYQQHGISTEDRTDPYRHIQVVDPDGKYVLEWEVNWPEERVIFNITVETRGYIGLGLSKKGLMTDADIVIGGVDRKGKPYFTDRYGIGRGVPEIDKSQDYILHEAWERGGKTFLSFSRAFETCDEDDLAITTDEVISIMWAYGERDDVLEYHHQNRGSFNAYILDPDLTPREIIEQRFRNVTKERQLNPKGDIKVWRIPITFNVPEQDTTYICSFHKAPPSPTKQHIIGFRPIMGELERRHIHHFILHICYPPPNTKPDLFFGPHTISSGTECYVLIRPSSIPAEYCLEMRHEWAVGGESLFFPDHLGLPFTATPNEFYMLQTHYDNPNLLPNLRLHFDLEVFYTSKEHDAGMMFVGNRPESGTIIIPPYSINHVIYGHCASQCTEKILPPTGVNVFATRMHTHLTGRGMRFIYVHNKTEVSLSIDDNYNFNYQAYRLLRKEKVISRGDMIYQRCIMSSEERDYATIGGYSTQNEMCHGFYWYYPYIPTYGICGSEIRSDVYRDFLQIRNFTWSDELRENVVTDPAHNAGLTVSQVASRINWTLDNRRQLQTHQIMIPPHSQCTSLGGDNIFIQTIQAIQSGRMGKTPLVGLLAGQLISRAAEASAAANLVPGGNRAPAQNNSNIQRRLGASGGGRNTRRLTVLNEIRFPGEEVVSLWPEILFDYKRKSVCAPQYHHKYKKW